MRNIVSGIVGVLFRLAVSSNALRDGLQEQGAYFVVKSFLYPALTALALVVLVCALIRLGDASLSQLWTPCDLWTETQNLATIRLIQAGESIYDRKVYDDSYFTLTGYTPLYHLLVASLPSAPNQPFLTGRIVSMTFMILSATLLFWPGRPGRLFLIPILAVGVFFCIRQIVCRTAYLRHDPMGLFFSGVAVISITNCNGWKAISVAAVSAAVAFLTKQTFLTAGLACLLSLGLTNRKECLFFASLWIGLIGTATVVIYFVPWGGPGIWFCWFVVPRHPMLLDAFLFNWKEMLGDQLIFGALLLLTVASAIAEVSRRGWHAWCGSPLFVFLTVATLAILTTSAKDGASPSSFFEFILACLLWLTYRARSVTQATILRSLPLLIILLSCSVATIELAKTPRDSYTYAAMNATRDRITFLNQLKLNFAQLGIKRSDKLLNLTNVPVAYCLTDTCFLNDVWLYPMLWRIGVLENSNLCRAITRQNFDVILLPARLNGDIPPEWQSVFQAIGTSYWPLREDTNFLYAMPKQEKSFLVNGADTLLVTW